MSSSNYLIATPDDGMVGSTITTGAQVDCALYRALAEQIAHDGIAVVPGFFAAPLIAEAARFAVESVKANGGEYISFGGSEGLPGFLLGQLGATGWFQHLCQGVYREMTGQAPPPMRFFQVLRCLSGRTGRVNSNYFHYDSYMLTVLVPLVIPDGEERGSLVLVPNLRRVRTSYLVNVIEKALFDRKWVQRLIARRTLRNAHSRRIDLEPGNLYLFCGYRSLHANEPCGERDIRATLLFHYANPHEHSGLRQALARRGGG